MFKSLLASLAAICTATRADADAQSIEMLAPISPRMYDILFEANAYVLYAITPTVSTISLYEPPFMANSTTCSRSITSLSLLQIPTKTAVFEPRPPLPVRYPPCIASATTLSSMRCCVSINAASFESMPNSLQSNESIPTMNDPCRLYSSISGSRRLRTPKQVVSTSMSQRLKGTIVTESPPEASSCQNFSNESHPSGPAPAKRMPVPTTPTRSEHLCA